MIKIFNEDWTLYKHIKKYDYSRVILADINQFTIFEYDENLINKILRFYRKGELVYSGIIKNISIDENEQKYNLRIFSLIDDLKRNFYTDNSWNYIVYKNDTIKNVLTDIINKYRQDWWQILSLGSLDDVGNINYTFKYVSFFNAFKNLFKFLNNNSYIRVNPDWTIDLKNTEEIKRLVYKKDVLSINYSFNTDNIINYVYFDNKGSWDVDIKKTYEDTTSINKYGKRVKYITDTRIKTEQWADELINAYLSKHSQSEVIINNIITTKDIPLFSKIRIDNWNKKINELYINDKVYNKDWTINLVIGKLDTSREEIWTIQDKIDVLEDKKDIPNYITQTKITSTEIESPRIIGNDWYFTETFKVGQDWIEINAVNTPYIQSSNYNAWNEWRRIDNNWDAEFNNLTARGTLQSNNYGAWSTWRRVNIDWDAEFNSLTAKGTIQSSNYSAGSKGRKIDDNWDAEFNSITAKWTFTITGGNWISNLSDAWNLATANNLDDVSDGSNYKKTTQDEKTWWGRAYNALNASNRYKEWLDLGELTTWNNPSTWIVIDNAWIRGYDNSTKTFEIKTNWWDWYFRGNIYANNWTFAGSISSSATITGWTIQTSTSGQRVVIDGSNNHIQFYDSGNNNVGYLYGNHFSTSYGSWYVIESSGHFWVGGSLIIKKGIVTGEDIVVWSGKIVPYSDWNVDLWTSSLWFNWMFLYSNTYIHWNGDGWELRSDWGHLYYYDGSNTHTIV